MKILSSSPSKIVIWLIILASMRLLISSSNNFKVDHELKSEIENLQSSNLSITHLPRLANTNVSSKNQKFSLLQFKVNSAAYTCPTLAKLIEKHSNNVLIVLVAMIVALVVSVFSVAYLGVKIVRNNKAFKGREMKYIESGREAERKQMMKSIAIATASHDVRASLAGITGLIDLSYSHVVSGSELETNLRQMGTCATDLLALLNSILDSSKIEAGKMQVEQTEFDLPKLLEDVADLYHPVGMKKGVDIVLDPTDGSLNRYGIVKGDRLKLKQVITNLLSNAVKFTAEGHVSVRAWARRPVLDDLTMTSSSRNTWSSFFLWKSKKMAHLEKEDRKIMKKQDPDCLEFVFEVDDTGKGIPKDEWKSVFENYVQVKDASMVGGTGLGLGIVQSLVRLMGGDIEIVEKKCGERGTCFKFNIFLTKCSKDSTSNLVGGGLNNQKSSSSLVILLLQNEGRRKMIHRFLESLGIMVVEAKEAKVIPSLVETCHRGDPNKFVLLIVDANAGEFSQVKKLSRESFCKLVWLETRESRQNTQGEKMVPLADYVTSKPLHGSRLFQVIRFLPEFNGESKKLHYSQQDMVDEIDKVEISRLSGKRVLIVEDDKVLMLVASKIVMKMGATVEKCHNGQEAIDLICKSLADRFVGGISEPPFDYILMDCQMPLVDGFKATRVIRKEEMAYGLHMPIISLTAHVNGEEQERMLRAGMDYHLEKPLQERKLIEAIEFVERENDEL